MDANLQILGLAKKAGLLAVGAEDTISAARAGKAAIIVSAGDASAGALKRARKSAESYRTPHIVVPYSGFDLGNVSGRGSPGTIAILDKGLAARFMRGMAETDPEHYAELAALLTGEAREKAESRKNNQSGNRRTSI